MSGGVEGREGGGGGRGMKGVEHVSFQFGVFVLQKFRWNPHATVHPKEVLVFRVPVLK